MNQLNEKYLSLIKKSLTGCLDTSDPDNWQFNIASTKAFKTFMTNGQVRTLIGPKVDNIENSLNILSAIMLKAILLKRVVGGVVPYCI